MQPDDGDSVSQWLSLLKDGHASAAQHIWEQYFARLVNLARDRLRATGVDDEVVAASAFNSFCMAAMKGRFPRLNDRNDLWQLLIFITKQKATNHLRKQRAQRRGGDAVVKTGTVLQAAASPEPTPEFAAMMIEEFNGLLDRLGDDTQRRIALLKMEGYTHEEIAAELDCAVRTVANKLELIRRMLDAGGDDE
ncbi:MAG: ECF-type sigma factor [Gemmataceae bacterium]